MRPVEELSLAAIEEERDEDLGGRRQCLVLKLSPRALRGHGGRKGVKVVSAAQGGHGEAEESGGRNTATRRVAMVGRR